MSDERLGRPTFEKLRRDFVDNYYNLIVTSETLNKLLEGKLTPEKEVHELNQGLEVCMGRMHELRQIGKNLYGIDLPDPYDPRGESKTDFQQ